MRGDGSALIACWLGTGCMAVGNKALPAQVKASVGKNRNQPCPGMLPQCHAFGYYLTRMGVRKHDGKYHQMPAPLVILGNAHVFTSKTLQVLTPTCLVVNVNCIVVICSISHW